MKVEVTVNPRVKKNKSSLEVARKRYAHWRNSTPESRMYCATLFALARGVCPVCNKDMVLSFSDEFKDVPNRATLDHTDPLSVTLETDKLGLTIMCRECNRSKADKIIPAETISTFLEVAMARTK